MLREGFSGLFNHQTNYDVKNQLTVFSLRQLEDVLRPIAMHADPGFYLDESKDKNEKETSDC